MLTFDKPKYAKLDNGLIAKVIGETVYSDPNEKNDGLCYITKSGFAINEEHVIKVADTLEGARE